MNYVGSSTVLGRPRTVRSDAQISRRIDPLLGASAVLLVVCFLTALAPQIAPVMPLVLINLLVLAFSTRALGPTVTAPALYFAFFLTFNGLAGFVFSNSLSEARGSGAVYEVLTVDQTVDTASLFLAASTFICLGAIAGYRFLNAEHRKIDVMAALKFEGMQRMSPLILISAVVVLIGIVAAAGLSELLYRNSYLLNARAGLGSILTIASIGMIIALGVVLAANKSAYRWLAFALLLLFASYFVSLGSRRLALVPILLLAGYILAGGKFDARIVTFAALASGALLALPLHFRQQAAHGLLPHLQSLGSLSFNSEAIEANVNNVLVGFRIVGLTAFDRAAIPWSTFLTSISPLSGEAANWYEISDSVRINIFSPYGAIGEIGNRGWPFTIFWFLLFGLVLGAIQRYNTRLLASPKLRLVGFLVLGILAIAALQSTQYNLRTEMRLVYYSAFLLVIAMGIRSCWHSGQLGSHSRL